MREAERLAATADDFASDYGMMILWGNAACASHRLGRSAESDRWLRQMESQIEENRPATIRTLLCRGEDDAAERPLIDAFASPNWGDQAILWMQDWAPEPGTPTPAVRQMEARFDALRRRPAVLAAFARVGHRLRLPLPGRVYGFCRDVGATAPSSPRPSTGSPR